MGNSNERSSLCPPLNTGGLHGEEAGASSMGGRLRHKCRANPGPHPSHIFPSTLPPPHFLSSSHLGVHGDAVLGAVRQQVLPALVALDELGVPPRRNHLQPGVKGLTAHLEPDLVVALPPGPAHDKAGLLGVRDLDHLLRDHGRGVARVDALVSAAGYGLGLDGVKVLVVLPHLAQKVTTSKPFSHSHLRMTDVSWGSRGKELRYGYYRTVPTYPDFYFDFQKCPGAQFLLSLVTASL